MADNSEVRFIAAALRRLDVLSDRLAKAISLLEEYTSIQELLRDITVEFPGQIDDLRDGLIQILKILEHQPERRLKTSQLIESLERDGRDSLKRQLLRQHQTLNLLQEEAAKRGPSLDITLTAQIIKTQEEIARLNRLLNLPKK